MGGQGEGKEERIPSVIQKGLEFWKISIEGRKKGGKKCAFNGQAK